MKLPLVNGRVKTIMLSSDPTFLGVISSVSGSAVDIQLSGSVESGLSIIEGRTYRIGQVGSFVRIPQGYQDLFAIVTGINSDVPSGDASSHKKWLTAQLIGEAIGQAFERGISQYPNIGDHVHIATESTLSRIYGQSSFGDIPIGHLSSAETIQAKISLDPLVTRHSTIVGSTGAGKSTTVASILRSITGENEAGSYPSARVLLLDIHGEYAKALSDVSQVFSVDPEGDDKELLIPYWALDSNELLDFLTGGVKDQQETAFTDKIFELKVRSHKASDFPGVIESSLTVDTPIPFSLKSLWSDLIDFEISTFEGPDRDQPALLRPGDPEAMIPPTYKPHAMGAQGPFLNAQAYGIRRHLNLLRSRMMDRRYDFLLHPGEWEPALDGSVDADLDALLGGWLGGDKPITILNLSGVPSVVLERLIGSILKIVYESMFWSREKSEGSYWRPVLIVMEEAHRYLSKEGGGLAADITQKIVKEGRKYGIGAMIVSQRPSEVDETILSQCGTFFTLRLSNARDRTQVQGTLPDSLVGLLDVLPVLRTGEVIVLGEAAPMPMRSRVYLPTEDHRPDSGDPRVSDAWSIPRREEGYDRVVASWRSQKPFSVAKEVRIKREPVEDDS